MNNKYPENHYDNAPNQLAHVARLAQIIKEMSEKGAEVYITAKELDNRGLELIALRDEIVAFYETERTRIVEVFKEWKGSREFIQEKITECMKSGDIPGRDTFIDLYKQYMNNVNSFDSKTFKNDNDDQIEDATIIDI